MKKNRIMLGILWILSIIGISFYGGAVSYGFFFALTLMPIISYVYLLCVYFRFHIYQEVQSREMICRQSLHCFWSLVGLEKEFKPASGTRYDAAGHFYKESSQKTNCKCFHGNSN